MSSVDTRHFAQKVSFGRSVLCGPLGISAFSAFNRHFYSGGRKIHRGPKRRRIRYATLRTAVYRDGFRLECDSGLSPMRSLLLAVLAAYLIAAIYSVLAFVYNRSSIQRCAEL